ncbi:MAG: AbrB/MazE/SpoVT family DNA-binding domain-containing protein [Actinobacteria bacterium]|nr:AbrB/MazE/SpoVT family DNA-binding domain-containing protein [Actinomycetota bacterium]
MKVSQKGQITIPKHIRDALDIVGGFEVTFDLTPDGEGFVVRKTAATPTRRERLAERLRGSGDVDMSTDEIMALTRGS